MERVELNELESFKTDIRTMLSDALKNIRDIVDHYTQANEREHNEIREEQKTLRETQRQIFKAINTSDKATDEKVTAVRLSLENQVKELDTKIDKLEKAPGDAALEAEAKRKAEVRTLVRGIASGVLSTLTLMVILWILSQVFGGSPPPA